MQGEGFHLPLLALEMPKVSLRSGRPSTDEVPLLLMSLYDHMSKTEINSSSRTPRDSRTESLSTLSAYALALRRLWDKELAEAAACGTGYAPLGNTEARPRALDVPFGAASGEQDEDLEPGWAVANCKFAPAPSVVSDKPGAGLSVLPNPCPRLDC